MWTNIDELIKTATNQSKRLNSELKRVDDLMNKMLLNVPEKDKQKVAEIAGLMQRSINFAKSGNYEKAKKEIENFEKTLKNEH